MTLSTPGLESLLPFAAFWLVAVLTPGPNMLLFTWLAVSAPRKVAVGAIAGIQSAMLIWAFSGLFGLAWFIERFPGTFRAVQVAGGLYLIWRGFVLVKSAWAGGPGALRPLQPASDFTPQSAYRAGFLTNMSNPKTLAFVASLFATTSVIHGPLWLGLLGIALMIAMSLSYYLICLWLFTRAGALAAYARSERYITGGAGAIFAFFGLQLLNSGLMF
ncbi:MAG TPA: LysE family transporter [Nordella sp.]|nr:LysE family transporter [Nordella sp.]